MRIEELTPGQPITLLIVAKDQQLEFSSTVLESLPRKHTIITTPVMKDDKVIAFHGKGFLVHLIVPFPDQKPYVFRNVTVYTAKKKDDSLCYTITTLAESKEFNRRGAFRCFVGIDTSVRIGSYRSSIEVTIKDVSSTGFSFTSSSEIKYNQNDIAHAVLNDYIEETAKKYSFHLLGNIIRCFRLGNGIIVYGCKFNTKIVGIDRYIMEKERIRLQRSRGTSNTIIRRNK
ncbi:MAG TPA: PilZ domain-containing protein [Lachnospiraceae bacterium]|nr:PilZ domain-containing protein [Lachnospiraceae bacterium]